MTMFENIRKNYTPPKWVAKLSLWVPIIAGLLSILNWSWDTGKELHTTWKNARATKDRLVEENKQLKVLLKDSLEHLQESIAFSNELAKKMAELEIKHDRLESQMVQGQYDMIEHIEEGHPKKYSHFPFTKPNTYKGSSELSVEEEEMHVPETTQEKLVPQMQYRIPVEQTEMLFQKK